MQRNHIPPRPGAGASLLLTALAALGCEISPVVTPPEMPSSRYRDCEHASETYCEHVIGAGGQGFEKCVAEFTLKCVSGRDL